MREVVPNEGYVQRWQLASQVGVDDVLRRQEAAAAANSHSCELITSMAG